jgi:hypothetical protein
MSFLKSKFKLIQFVIVVLLFQIKPIFAKDYICERAFFEDKTGTLSFQEVKEKDFVKVD